MKTILKLAVLGALLAHALTVVAQEHKAVAASTFENLVLSCPPTYDVGAIQAQIEAARANAEAISIQMKKEETTGWLSYRDEKAHAAVAIGSKLDPRSGTITMHILVVDRGLTNDASSRFRRAVRKLGERQDTFIDIQSGAGCILLRQR